VTIQIGVHSTGEEHDQHNIRVAPRVSRTTIVCKVPTKSKSELYSWNEVLAPSDRPVRSSSWCLILPPLNHLKAGRERFNKLVTALLGLLGPINLTYGQYKWKLVHQSQNNLTFNRHRQVLPPWNLEIATTIFPPFPSEWSTFPYLSRPVTPTDMNINIASTHRNHHILLVHEKEVLHASETYHSSSTDVYQLSITHLVVNINTSITRMTYGRVLPCDLSPSYKVLHVVHNQHM
jgi:hypothetical protein